jgi:hypothetical protein
LGGECIVIGGENIVIGGIIHRRKSMHFVAGFSLLLFLLLKTSKFNRYRIVIGGAYASH